MPYDPETGRIEWKLHLSSEPARVYEMVATDAGRARFWAESASNRDGTIVFRFPNGLGWAGRILDWEEDRSFAVDYFGVQVSFLLDDDGAGGTDLTLVDEGGPQDDRLETLPGWVSVLMALKAAVDHGVDLRNHDPSRTWDQGYVDN